MTALPDPKPGLVFRYDYVWSREAAAGRLQGKDRPACLVATVDPLVSPRFVVILPITHSSPDAGTVAIEIPARVQAAIGLDEARSWIVVSDFNIDQWPNGGLSPVPGRKGAFSYGFIPPGLFAKVKEQFLALHETKQARGYRRQ